MKAERNLMCRELAKSRAAAGITNLRGVDKAVAAERLAEVPKDSRTMAQIMCGDPIFERSALYKRLSQSR